MMSHAWVTYIHDRVDHASSEKDPGPGLTSHAYGVRYVAACDGTGGPPWGHCRVAHLAPRHGSHPLASQRATGASHYRFRPHSRVRKVTEDGRAGGLTRCLSNPAHTVPGQPAPPIYPTEPSVRVTSGSCSSSWLLISGWLKRYKPPLMPAKVRYPTATSRRLSS